MLLAVQHKQQPVSAARELRSTKYLPPPGCHFHHCHHPMLGTPLVLPDQRSTLNLLHPQYQGVSRKELSTDHQHVVQLREHVVRNLAVWPRCPCPGQCSQRLLLYRSARSKCRQGFGYPLARNKAAPGLQIIVVETALQVGQQYLSQSPRPHHPNPS